MQPTPRLQHNTPRPADSTRPRGFRSWRVAARAVAGGLAGLILALGLAGCNAPKRAENGAGSAAASTPPAIPTAWRPANFDGHLTAVSQAEGWLRLALIPFLNG